MPASLSRNPRRTRARGRLALRWWRREIVGSVDYRRVVQRVDDDAGWSPRFAFMTVMSAGIAVLGLLLSSPAVIIGAMLISPLMGPIIGLGFALAIFEWREVRRSLVALGIGSVFAVLFCATVVLLSPLQAVTPEILARTRPNLFDLLVAVFSALAGTYATIRGRGETIVGVAIATALMPPLAVVGFGLATASLPVLGGAFALFVTNLIAIALCAAIMARFYGFGSELSPKQTRAQAGLILAVFVLMSVPLALALRTIAWEAVVSRQVRSEIAGYFGPGARISQLDVDFARQPLTASAVVLTDSYRDAAGRALAERIKARIGRPAQLRLSQIVVDQDVSRLAQDRAVLDRQQSERGEMLAISEALAAASGSAPAEMAVDPEARTAVAVAPQGAALAALRAAEAQLASAHPDWQFRLVPPLAPLPLVRFPPGEAGLDATAEAALADMRWALRRWRLTGVTVLGRAATRDDSRASSRTALARARAEAVAAWLRAEGVAARARVDPAGPLQRAGERERGVAQYRSVVVVPEAAPPPD